MGKPPEALPTPRTGWNPPLTGPAQPLLQQGKDPSPQQPPLYTLGLPYPQGKVTPKPDCKPLFPPRSYPQPAPLLLPHRYALSFDMPQLPFTPRSPFPRAPALMSPSPVPPSRP